MSPHEAAIATLHSAALDHLLKSTGCWDCARKKEQARGVLIEAMYDSRSTRASTEAPSGFERVRFVAPPQGRAEEPSWFTEDTKRIICIDKLRTKTAEAADSRGVHLEFKEFAFAHLCPLLKTTYPLDEHFPILNPPTRPSVAQHKSFPQSLIEAAGEGARSRTCGQLPAQA